MTALSESRPDFSVIGRLHRNAVKQRLFRRFVRRRDSQEHPSLKRMADIFFSRSLRRNE